MNSSTTNVVKGDGMGWGNDSDRRNINGPPMVLIGLQKSAIVGLVVFIVSSSPLNTRLKNFMSPSSNSIDVG